MPRGRGATQTPPTAPAGRASEPHHSVQFAVLGGDVRQLDYTPGMTVQQALDAAGQRVGNGQTLTVDGRPANPGDTLRAGAVVQLTKPIRNG